MQGREALVVQVENPDALALADARAVGESSRPAGRPDLDPEHRPDHAPWRIQIVEKAVQSVVEDHSLAVPGPRGPHRQPRRPRRLS